MMRRTAIVMSYLLAAVMGALAVTVVTEYYGEDAQKALHDSHQECLSVLDEAVTRLKQTEKMMDSCIQQYAEEMGNATECERRLNNCIKIEFEFGPKGKKR